MFDSSELWRLFMADVGFRNIQSLSARAFLNSPSRCIYKLDQPEKLNPKLDYVISAQRMGPSGFQAVVSSCFGRQNASSDSVQG